MVHVQLCVYEPERADYPADYPMSHVLVYVFSHAIRPTLHGWLGSVIHYYLRFCSHNHLWLCGERKESLYRRGLVVCPW